MNSRYRPLMADYLSLLGLSQRDLLDRKNAYRKARTLGDGCYVYALWRNDRPHPTPFYIGKGKGLRVLAHFYPCTSGESPIKDRIIAKLALRGLPPMITVLDAGLTDAQAHRLEMTTIRKLGRINLRTGPLANLTDGGEGMSGHLGLKGSANPAARAVIVNGQRYDTAADAARALGLTRIQVTTRIIKGCRGFQYADEAPRSPPPGHAKGAHNPRSKSVIAEGRRFETLSAAAQCLGVCPSAVHKRINFGWDGYYYVDEGQRKRSRPPRYSSAHIDILRSKARNNPRPVSVDGISYQTVSAAADAIGVSRTTIVSRCKSDRFPTYCFQA